MNTPLSREIKQILDRLGVKGLAPDALHRTFEARESLLPNSPNGKKITANTFWDLSPRFRFDALISEIPTIERQLRYSIAQASIYSSFVRYTLPFQVDDGHTLFWYHIDFGTRLISSGWDRLALLLDLCLGLELKYDCSFPRVLATIPKKHAALAKHKAFKWLKRYRDGEFQELEAGRGAGKRHESTHLLSASSRDFWETLEDMTSTSGAVRASDSKRVITNIEFLEKHHAFYQQGIRLVAELIAVKFPKKADGAGGHGLSRVS